MGVAQLFKKFTPRQKRNKLNINLVIDGKQIMQTKDNIFLGVVIDEHLSWKSHVYNVANKISKSIGIIYKASFFLPKARFPLGEFVRATRSENKNSAT